ncbi:MAG: cyclophilin-like fold protein [Anaerolineae bacterium]|nr:cyclophilin-like fold protein [Anaerolineae bacterium]
MGHRTIRISAGGVSALADLNDTRTAQAIWEALPIRAQASTWGDEVYFEIPVRMGTEKGQAVVAKGDVGYWAPGRAFCIFFGLTPASRGDEIRPASPVTVVGRVRGDATVFRQVREGEEVVLERAEQAD